ncbi:MAG: hypothetical protein RLY71_436 [Pseudomonadota bacterium]|jgi:hypothetical protein
MAIDLTFATGSAVTISTTELSLISGTTTLQTSTTAGIYELVLDCANMTATEAYELRIYETAVAGGTKHLVRRKPINGAQAEPILVLPSLLLGVGWDITMDKLAGTDRAFSWSVRKVA